MKKRKAFLDHIYKCIGEDFGKCVDIGYCGEDKRLIDWFMLLFTDATEEEIIENYGNYSKDFFIDYILIYAGKRLERVKA